jgi:protein-tyrosine phosphatase
MLDDGRAHLLATDAHDTKKRYPNLRRGRDLAAAHLGDLEAEHLVLTRPQGVLKNTPPSSLPVPEVHVAESAFTRASPHGMDSQADTRHGLLHRLRRLFG